MKDITYADVIKAEKATLAEAYKEFQRNPSAVNYVKLETAMLNYQNAVKN